MGMTIGVGGSPRNVCNCRCCLLQRARWALDEDELNTLKERAEYFGLDKTDDFGDFKNKYLKAQESERVRGSAHKTTDHVKTLENTAKDSKIDLNLQFFAKSSKDYETVVLSKDEYAHVMSELNTHLSDEQRKQKVVTKAIGNYNYTIENNGFDNYRIIGKEDIDSDVLDWWDKLW